MLMSTDDVEPLPMGRLYALFLVDVVKFDIR